VAQRRADDVDVDGAEALLARGQPVVRRRLVAEEVGHQRVHPRRREQDGRIVLGRDERGRRRAPVVVGLVEAQEGLADLV
jgi:hypothetical protein